jgi:cytochrome c oxidase cbb3-type subunit 2
MEQEWQPSASAIARGDLAEGKALYQQQCATCHDANGRARLQYQSQFKQSPTNLATGPFQYLRLTASSADRNAMLSRISKFGIQGTDMAGHEYLSDQQIASLTLFLMNQFSNSVHHP